MPAPMARPSISNRARGSGPTAWVSETEIGLTRNDAIVVGRRAGSCLESSSARGRAGLFRIWPAAVIVLLATLAYHNSFSVPFVFDDQPSVVDNPTLRHGVSIEALSPPRGQGITVEGRPALNL